MTAGDRLLALYEDNFSHFDFIEAMNGGECDCSLHRIANGLQEEEAGE